MFTGNYPEIGASGYQLQRKGLQQQHGYNDDSESQQTRFWKMSVLGH
jgi:hypothetical protein